MVGKPTSFDVAELAGVSQPTVSRALRNRGGVDPETRKRIVEAARTLDYRPDQRAVSLRSGSTGRIAVVILGTPARDSTRSTSFYMALLAHVAEAAARRGYAILVSFQTEDGSFNGDYHRTGSADAIIVVGTSTNAAGWRYFVDAHRRGENIVCWGSPTDHVPTIRSDNRGGAAAAVRHLLDGGRERVAFLGPGWRRQRAYRERRAGYLDVMHAGKRPPIEAPWLAAASREQQGHAATASLLDVHPDIDAIFAASDTLAIGAIRAVQSRNRSVPDDVAVIGFDGIDAGGYLSPSLTTIRQDLVLAGERLVAAALAIAAGDAPDLRSIDATLIVRDSTNQP